MATIFLVLILATSTGHTVSAVLYNQASYMSKEECMAARPAVVAMLNNRLAEKDLVVKVSACMNQEEIADLVKKVKSPDKGA